MSGPERRERVLIVTGRLAESAVRDTVSQLSRQVGFDFEIAVLGISVAALLTPEIVARKLQVEGHFDRVILPGWCQGNIEALSDRFGLPFELGPKDIHDLGIHFGRGGREPADLSKYDIEIIAEINHAPRMSEEAVVWAAEAYRHDGADVIDLGCVPGATWNDVSKTVKRLIEDGFRVSIDSFNRIEVEAAVDAGAELVLSCNSSNVDWASQLAAELVVIPDSPSDLPSLERTLEALHAEGSRYRLDPILEPLGFGFTESVVRYRDVRKRWPEAEIMMGVGNLSELTEVDSAGVNTLLMGMCQELKIRSVLTTQVINWCRTSVRELDCARRIMHFAMSRGTPPKHVDSSLVMLRDPNVQDRPRGELEKLQTLIRDPNFRIFADGGELHLMNRGGHWHGADPYEVFERALAANDGIDQSHAFYLGYELAKATTALTLGKKYVQDEPLRWGMLTQKEASAIERRHQASSRPDANE